MICSGENVLAGMILLLLAVNLIGLSLPVWYKKEHEHNTGINATVVTDVGCTVHMKIREGLWQRSCKESWRKGELCEIDIQGESKQKQHNLFLTYPTLLVNLTYS